ncbi:hypothetical protein GLOIN_2v1528288 [Rhizophagus irregularis DAOM 181602=DAOM 197198]|nr:hypothetical protein GLOIN_2v1528288 [Rhizophagus irregularis DAOM 181602=DAOM 197198]
MKAMKLLINFNELINSNSVRDYWNSIRTEICHVRSNALNEHIIESDKIIVGKRKSTDGYPPTYNINICECKDHSSPFVLPSDFNHDHTNCEEDIEPEYYDTRKRHKIHYSWKDVIEKVNFRDSSKKDVSI